MTATLIEKAGYWKLVFPVRPDFYGLDPRNLKVLKLQWSEEENNGEMSYELTITFFSDTVSHDMRRSAYLSVLEILPHFSVRHPDNAAR
jgi:hypothetical protein